MFCIECGQALPDSAKFCQGCGTAIVSAPPVAQVSPPSPAISDEPSVVDAKPNVQPIKATSRGLPASLKVAYVLFFIHGLIGLIVTSGLLLDSQTHGMEKVWCHILRLMSMVLMWFSVRTFRNDFKFALSVGWFFAVGSGLLWIVGIVHDIAVGARVNFILSFLAVIAVAMPGILTIRASRKFEFLRD